MTSADPLIVERRNFPMRILDGLAATIWFLGRILVHGWATLAIYFSPIPWEWLRVALAAGSTRRAAQNPDATIARPTCRGSQAARAWLNRLRVRPMLTSEAAC